MAKYISILCMKGFTNVSPCVNSWKLSEIIVLLIGILTGSEILFFKGRKFRDKLTIRRNLGITVRNQGLF